MCVKGLTYSLMPTNFPNWQDLAELNTDQRRAVTLDSTSTVALLLAGPGSGKTRVVTTRWVQGGLVACNSLYGKP